MPCIRSGKSSLAQCLSPFGFGSFFRMTNGQHWLLSTLLQRRRVVHSCWIPPIYDICKIFLSPPIFPHFKLIFISCISRNLPYFICLSFTPFPLSYECHIWKPPCILWRMGKSMQLWWRVRTWGTCIAYTMLVRMHTLNSAWDSLHFLAHCTFVGARNVDTGKMGICHASQLRVQWPSSLLPPLTK